MLGQGTAQQGKGAPASNGQTLPQHSSRPAVQRQKTLLQRVVGKRITNAATRRFSPIKHDADYAGGQTLTYLSRRCPGAIGPSAALLAADALVFNP